MGVDYSANHGFGVKVLRNKEEDFIDWLDEQLENTELYYFEVGSSIYGGEEKEVYVCINIEDEIDKDNGYDFIKYSADELTRVLIKKGIGFIGVPNIVGGLNIW